MLRDHTSVSHRQWALYWVSLQRNSFWPRMVFAALTLSAGSWERKMRSLRSHGHDWLAFLSVVQPLQHQTSCLSLTRMCGA